MVDYYPLLFIPVFSASDHQGERILEKLSIIKPLLKIIGYWSQVRLGQFYFMRIRGELSKWSMREYVAVRQTHWSKINSKVVQSDIKDFTI